MSEGIALARVVKIRVGDVLWSSGWVACLAGPNRRGPIAELLSGLGEGSKTRRMLEYGSGVD